MAEECPIVICVPKEDLRFYSTQGFAPQPTPPLPPPRWLFFNVAQYYSYCSSGIISFSGTLPSWMSIDNTNHRIVCAANTFGGITQVSANSKARAELDSFVNDGIVSGAFSCGADCDNSDISTPPDWNPMVLPASIRIKNYAASVKPLIVECLTAVDGAFPEWDGSWPTRDDGGEDYKTGVWPLNCKAKGFKQGGDSSNGCVVYIDDGSFPQKRWTIFLAGQDAGNLTRTFWCGTKSYGQTPVGTYTFENIVVNGTTPCTTGDILPSVCVEEFAP